MPTDQEHQRFAITTRAYTRDEAWAAARAYLIETYGAPKDMGQEQKDRFHERSGLIYAMICEMFPL